MTDNQEEKPKAKKKIVCNDRAITLTSKVEETPNGPKTTWFLVKIQLDLDTGTIGDVVYQEQEDMGMAMESAQLALEEEIFPEG